MQCMLAAVNSTHSTVAHGSMESVGENKHKLTSDSMRAIAECLLRLYELAFHE